MTRPFLRSILLCLALLSTPVHAVGILPLSGSQQFDNVTGTFAVGGQLFIYRASTTTCASIFADVTLTIPHPCPIILAGAARIPAIYATDGTLLRMRLLNINGVPQFDEDQIPVVTAITPATATPVQPPQLFGTRDVKIRFDDQPLEGYVRMNGRTIGSAGSGATERANVDAQSLFLALWGYANISVVTGKGGSAAADWAANKQLTLPDMAGRLVGAMDDLGNGAVGRITAATCATPSAVGTGCGAQTQTLTVAQLPAVTPAGTIAAPTISIADPGHGHPGSTVAVQNGPQYAAAGGNTPFAAGGSLGVTVANNTTSITATSSAPVLTGTPFGGGTAHPILSPVMLFTVYLKL